MQGKRQTRISRIDLPDYVVRAGSKREKQIDYSREGVESAPAKQHVGQEGRNRGQKTITDRIKIFNLASGVHTEF